MISLLKYLHKEAWLKSQAFFVVDIGDSVAVADTGDNHQDTVTMVDRSCGIAALSLAGGDRWIETGVFYIQLDGS